MATMVNYLFDAYQFVLMCHPILVSTRCHYTPRGHEGLLGFAAGIDGSGAEIEADIQVASNVESFLVFRHRVLSFGFRV